MGNPLMEKMLGLPEFEITDFKQNDNDMGFYFERNFIMQNLISLTIRLPLELNKRLLLISEKLGMNRTNLIRNAIHTFLENQTELDFSQNHSSLRERMNLNVNHLTFQILENVSIKYNQSINSVVVAICFTILERYSTLL